MNETLIPLTVNHPDHPMGKAFNLAKEFIIKVGEQKAYEYYLNPDSYNRAKIASFLHDNGFEYYSDEMIIWTNSVLRNIPEVIAHYE
jgi:hypothetical protein